MSGDKRIYLDCCCENEVLRVECDNGYFDVALFSRRSTSMWERVREVWRILRTGEPWGDQFIMNWHDANRLVAFLIQHNEEHNVCSVPPEQKVTHGQDHI